MEKIKAQLTGEKISSNSTGSFSLYEKSAFGEKVGSKVVYNLYEALYLIEQGKMNIFTGSKKLTQSILASKFNKIDKNFSLKYSVFSDLRKKGFVCKAGLKFGADFRVYDKSQNREHAKWLLFVVSENSKLSWSEFAAKNRIAHSTNKKLLVAVVDSEEKVSYYESGWEKL